MNVEHDKCIICVYFDDTSEGQLNFHHRIENILNILFIKSEFDIFPFASLSSLISHLLIIKITIYTYIYIYVYVQIQLFSSHIFPSINHSLTFRRIDVQRGSVQALLVPPVGIPHKRFR